MVERRTAGAFSEGLINKDCVYYSSNFNVAPHGDLLIFFYTHATVQ